MTDKSADLHPSDEVSDEAFAELSARVDALAEAMRAALTFESLSSAIGHSIQPVVAALALRQRDIGGHTLH